LHESVEVPEVVVVVSEMLVGVRLHDRPETGKTDVTLTPTVPVYPPLDVALMTDVPGNGARVATEDGVAVRVKSWTVILTTTVLTSPLPDPVTVTL
jgi:hypothetical protein